MEKGICFTQNPFLSLGQLFQVKSFKATESGEEHNLQGH